MAGKQRDFPRYDTELGPPRSGGGPRGQSPSHDVVESALKIEVHLLAGLIFKDQNHRILTLINPPLHLRKHFLDGPCSDQALARENSISRFVVHRLILPR